MVHFHPLRIKHIQKETPDCVVVTFDVPETLHKDFAFTQGQHLTLRRYINGQEQRRNYSLCSSPLDKQWRIAVKKVEGGLFSTFANHELKAGDEIDVMPPMGRFHIPLQPENKKNYLAFAAGSGITPILSIIKTTLLTEPHSSFTLVFGNRNRGSIIFKEELEALKNKFIERFRIYHILSRERTDSDLNHGRIDAEKCSTLFSKLVQVNTINDFFICGPQEMIHDVRGFLEAAGVHKQHIHFELFTTGNQVQKKAAATGGGAETGPQASITIKLDGISSSFPLGYNGESILDAALQQGADLPFACKGGVCCTCRAKLVSGKVEMDVNYGLEPDEIAAGYILTCQSHPRTGEVVIDFDR